MIINDFATAEYWNRAYKEGRTYRSVTPLETELFQYFVKAEPGMVAVDIGCGTGGWSRALASLGLSVTGYDFSDVAVAEATSLSSGHDNLRFAEWDVNSELSLLTSPAKRRHRHLPPHGSLPRPAAFSGRGSPLAQA